jgi:hypothetical protein
MRTQHHVALGLLLVLGAATLALARNMDDMEPSMDADLAGLDTETVFQEDEVPIGGEEQIGGESGIGGSTDSSYEATSQACENDPYSAACTDDKNARAATDRQQDDKAREIEAGHAKTGNDLNAYEALVAEFERHTNDWCCATSGKQLFNVSGDADVMNYMFYFLAQVFSQEGQQYGSNLVLQFHKGRADVKTLYKCNEVHERDAADYFASPVTAILDFKESLTAWMTANEVNPEDVIAQFFPQARSLFSSFLRGRLLHVKNLDEENEADQFNPEMALKLLPLFKDPNEPKDECEAGGTLFHLNPKSANNALAAEITRMLDICHEHGKLSADPVPFGEALLHADRKEQAREVFEYAVEHGALCNAYQRPEHHHRKDLTAKPVWGTDAFPMIAEALPTVRRQMADAIAEDADAFMGDAEVMQPYVKGGEWQRVSIYGQGQWNETLCAKFDDDCTALRGMIKKLVASNDGYEMSCNSSDSIEVWRLAKNTSTEVMIGATNIVLQHLSPIAGANRLVVQLGEETTTTDVADGASLVIDDTFENYVKVAGDDSALLTVLSVQVCHPDLHEKAMDMPSEKCVGDDEDDE